MRPAMPIFGFCGTQARLGLPSLAMAFVLILITALVPARAAVDIQEVRSDKGITAWLVEDYTVPLVSIRFVFEGGTTQDPDDKLGLANLMSGLFDEGAGDMDSDAFQEALDDVGAEMSFSATSDSIAGSMRTLADTREEAFRLLSLAVQKPRFDQAPVDRIRAQILTSIRANERDPDTLARRAFAKALYGDHPYSRPGDGLPDTLPKITPDDLKAFHKRVFARDNLKIAIVGAIDAETVKRELDRVFADLPEKADLVPVPDIAPKLDQTVRQVYDLPQTNIQLVYPGIARKDPEFFAAFMMNHVLGGGTFSSRLFTEVREQRGLAYGVSSGLSNLDHSSRLMMGTATASGKAEETLSVIKDVVARMAAEGPTEEELADAKRYQLGAYAINNLDSSASIANTLVQIQVEDLGIDYIERRGDLINAVTREQVAAVARRLLIDKPAVLIVGPEPGSGG